MIDRVLSSIAGELNEFLGSYYDLPEGMAELGEIGGGRGEVVANKMVVSLLNIEREGAMGINSRFKNAEGDRMVQGAPAWHLNIWFVVAAVFEEKRYAESLKMLSTAIVFLQRNNLLRTDGRQRFMIEPVTLDMQELTNLWSMLGGHYYPSVVCKIRMLTFDSGEIKKTVSRIKGVKL